MAFSIIKLSQPYDTFLQDLSAGKTVEIKNIGYFFIERGKIIGQLPDIEKDQLSSITDQPNVQIVTYTTKGEPNPTQKTFLEDSNNIRIGTIRFLIDKPTNQRLPYLFPNKLLFDKLKSIRKELYKDVFENIRK